MAYDTLQVFQGGKHDGCTKLTHKGDKPAFAGYMVSQYLPPCNTTGVIIELHVPWSARPSADQQGTYPMYWSSAPGGSGGSGSIDLVKVREDHVNKNIAHGLARTVYNEFKRMPMGSTYDPQRDEVTTPAGQRIPGIQYAMANALCNKMSALKRDLEASMQPKSFDMGHMQVGDIVTITKLGDEQWIIVDPAKDRASITARQMPMEDGKLGWEIMGEKIS